ncbi:hypothetical protein LX64_01582 [Chitinophaga skermanii]|uniref:Uncharacterized protein n=1 Tax=Chitinophaga skermanii TaxID=331697 RepID=A0A327R4V6_9BACT|nr:hypothetical protein [Chitinophaga skermanii]RAJ08927.1 hypothetical protein LX64_01582 [Chitinophaga skermanii]
MSVDKKQEIPAILSSLDGISRATPAPFFYTRLRARMQQGKASAWDNVVGFMSKPIVVIVFVGTILLLNGVTLLKQTNNTNPTTVEQAAIQGIRDEYNLASNNNVYEFIKSEP